jgi:CheY-like chemotaxis protein
MRETNAPLDGPENVSAETILTGRNPTVTRPALSLCAASQIKEYVGALRHLTVIRGIYFDHVLLHSEQATLDKFSSGFDDRYTVHCARTGTEALTTLGETPIHVIVSAQKLPGMSGAEALREAKKRSPETIGILLAGDSSEALVGEKEVFQVIRGGVDPAHLRQLIDNATQQSRLFALAESANDTRAEPDEPVAEHIIMETSENGSSIITDATGQLPALDPKKVSATAIGTASADVLVITKDQEFLTTIKESSRGTHTVHYANTLKQAEEAVRKNKVGVAVVDAAMVGDNVEKLTEHLRNRRNADGSHQPRQGLPLPAEAGLTGPCEARGRGFHQTSSRSAGLGLQVLRQGSSGSADATKTEPPARTEESRTGQARSRKTGSCAGKENQGKTVANGAAGSTTLLAMIRASRKR